MEPLVLLVVGGIALTLMIFGISSEKRIFNLLSIGAFITLAIEFSDNVGMLIMFFGLIVFNIYYTFLARYDG